MQNPSPVAYELPPIHVLEDEYTALSDLVCASPAESEAVALLWRELARAAVVKPETAPEEFVRMNSLVRYTDLTSGESQTVRLTYPDSEPGLHNVSVTSVLGAALIGLAPGAVFTWWSDVEGLGRITVDDVQQDGALGTGLGRRRPARTQQKGAPSAGSRLSGANASRAAFTPEGCAAARIVLGWSPDELAERAGLAAMTVTGFESRRRTPRHGSITAMLKAFDGAGVTFVFSQRVPAVCFSG